MDRFNEDYREDHWEAESRDDFTNEMLSKIWLRSLSMTIPPATDED